VSTTTTSGCLGQQRTARPTTGSIAAVTVLLVHGHARLTLAAAEIGCDQLIAAAAPLGESSPAVRPLNTPLADTS